MSLYGALYSGVSGLRAQSGKIAGISDNISNVNTIGYKQVSAQFETLVTAQALSAAYSPGGVLGGTRQLVDRQGLLVSTDSSTDIAISGKGFFAVNSQADNNGDTLYTRAGSFREDSTGNFRNAAGFYLMAWPLDSEGRVPGEAGNINTTPSSNLESLEIVNVKQISGVAVSTTSVAINANLKSTESVYPGAGATVAIDALSAGNSGIDSTDIIVPGGVNSIDRGDKFTISTGAGQTYTYRYGGYTFGRDVTTGANGDNNVDMLDASDTLGGTSLDVTGTQASGSIAVTNGSSVATVTLAGHGFKVGDQVTFSGLSTAIGGVAASNFNTTFTIASVATNSFTFSFAGGPAGSNGSSAEAATRLYHPLAMVTTSGSDEVLVRHADHGLQTGDVVTLSGFPAVGGLTTTVLNSSFVITVVDEDSYTITASADASSTTAGGGTTGLVTKRIFSGNILDATTATQTLLGTTGTSSFRSDALKLKITTATTGSVTFTYTASTPNGTLGQFNTINNLAEAINLVSGLNARVSEGRIFISPDDANEAISFSNGEDEGTTDSTGAVKHGINWVRELDLKDQTAGIERFNTLQGLADLVNDSAGLSATISSATSAARLTINNDDPLDTITFADPASVAASAVTGMSIDTTSGSKVVTFTHSNHGFRTGDKINITPPAGTYGGLSESDLTGDFIITVVNSNQYRISSATAATSTDTDTSLTVSVQGNKNEGSLLSEFGLADSLNSGSYAAGIKGPLGPEYDPLVSTKNMAGGEISPQFSRPIRVYDSLGSAHDVRLAFIKVASNTWAAEIYAVPASEVAFANGQIAYGTLTFNGDGSLRSVTTSLSNPISITWQNGAAISEVTFDWGTAGEIFGTTGASVIGKTDGMTQFDGAYNVSSVEQNGAAVGQLNGVQVTEEGFVVASYSNGSSQRLYRIPISDFSSPNELALVTGNVFAQSATSGEVSLRTAGTSGVGKIQSAALESSNVELSEELTNMIVAQRAYQANTKIITATDQLLQELNNLVR